MVSLARRIEDFLSVGLLDHVQRGMNVFHGQPQLLKQEEGRVLSGDDPKFLVLYKRKSSRRSHNSH